MSGVRRERKLKEARFAADYLERVGNKEHAQYVRNLIRTHSALAETTRRLWRDNEALRNTLAGVE